MGDDLGELLMQVESVTHREGWDQPASLMVVFDVADAATVAAYARLMPASAQIRRGPLAARPVLRPSMMAEALAIPSHALFRMAMNMHAYGKADEVTAFVDSMRLPGFHGMAFVVETWGRELTDSETRERESGLSFADLPGSFECRMAYAVHRDGTERIVRRVRGRKPELLDASDHGGSVIESLRVIVAQLASQPLPELVNVPFKWEWPQGVSDGASA